MAGGVLKMPSIFSSLNSGGGTLTGRDAGRIRLQPLVSLRRLVLGQKLEHLGRVRSRIGHVPCLPPLKLSLFPLKWSLFCCEEMIIEYFAAASAEMKELVCAVILVLFLCKSTSYSLLWSHLKTGLRRRLSSPTVHKSLQKTESW